MAPGRPFCARAKLNLIRDVAVRQRLTSQCRLGNNSAREFLGPKPEIPNGIWKRSSMREG